MVVLKSANVNVAAQIGGKPTEAPAETFSHGVMNYYKRDYGAFISELHEPVLRAARVWEVVYPDYCHKAACPSGGRKRWEDHGGARFRPKPGSSSIRTTGILWILHAICTALHYHSIKSRNNGALCQFISYTVHSTPCTTKYFEKTGNHRHSKPDYAG